MFSDASDRYLLGSRAAQSCWQSASAQLPVLHRAGGGVAACSAAAPHPKLTVTMAGPRRRMLGVCRRGTRTWSKNLQKRVWPSTWEGQTTPKLIHLETTEVAAPMAVS